jgi:hypothetical protein
MNEASSGEGKKKQKKTTKEPKAANISSGKRPERIGARDERD